MTAGPDPSARPDRADLRLRAGTLGVRHARAAGQWLAREHEGARAVALPGGVETLSRELASGVRSIEAAFPQLAGDPLREIERAQRAFLDKHADRLRARERAGRVHQGLGPPLELADLQVNDGGTVVRAHGRDPRADALPRDVCVDAAGVALELAGGRRGDLAERLLSAYAGAADDFDLYAVVDFYERRCALELAARRAAGADAKSETVLDEVRPLLLLALATRRRPLLPPVLVAVGGLVASGKSSVSRALSDRLAAPRIEADRARAFLLHRQADRPLHEAQWARELPEQVYGELLRRAEIVLDSGRPVVLDACFPSARQRGAARALARRRGRPFVFVECCVDPATARARLAERNAEPGESGWMQIYEDLATRWEPSDELAPEERLVLDTTRSLTDSEAALAARLPTWPVRMEG